MRQLPADLPDDPSPEQVNAWVELAELVADEDFRQRVRSMVLAAPAQAARTAQASTQAQAATQAQAETASQAQPDQAVAEHVGQAAAQGITPGSPEGKAVLDRIVPPGTPAAQRARLLEQLESFTDARVERYWQLLAIINGEPLPPSVVPGFEWLIAALHTDLS